MPTYNPQEAARLQAIVEADPDIQAAIRDYQALFFVANPNANRREREAAEQRLMAALNRNPVLKAAGVADRSVREGYELNPRAQRGRGLITKEGSDVGHVVRDIILPAAGVGAIAAAPAIIGSQAAAGGGSAGSAGAAGTALGVPGAPIAGGSVATGTIGGTGTIGALQGAGYAGSGGGGLGSWLTSDRLRAAGQGLGAIAQGKAINRGEEFAGQTDLARLLLERDAQFQNQSIAREQEGSRSGMDAWRRLLMAQRTLSPGPRPQLSPYSIAPRQATGAERQGATAMSSEVLQRLLGGNPIPVPQRTDLGVDPRLLRPGRMERILGYAAPAATIAGTVLRY